MSCSQSGKITDGTCYSILFLCHMRLLAGGKVILSQDNTSHTQQYMHTKPKANLSSTRLKMGPSTKFYCTTYNHFNTFMTPLRNDDNVRSSTERRIERSQLAKDLRLQYSAVDRQIFVCISAGSSQRVFNHTSL